MSEFLAHAAALHRDLLHALDLRRSDVARMADDELRALATRMLAVLVERRSLPQGVTASELVQFVLDEALGLGPLELLLAEDSVNEIMVNGPFDVFVEKEGRVQRSDHRFTGDSALRGVIDRIVGRVGRRVDEASPLVDARLHDGSRVNVVLPPLSLCGPVVTIRKFARHRLGLRDMVMRGSLSLSMLRFLEICVRHRKNIVVSGGTGSGKTTLLNVLSNLIPPHERIVTIEDAAELRLTHDNLVALEARNANSEGRGSITIRDLVRNALRMRPDRIVVGECRGGEALDMLQAMNTGHDGSLTTAHANSPRDVLTRLEVMALMAGVDLPLAAVREQIASAVDVIIQQARFPCGARKVTHIVEITGLESGRIATQELFRFHRRGADATGAVQGDFAACGQVPAFYQDLSERGVALDLTLFESHRVQGRPL